MQDDERARTAPAPGGSARGLVLALLSAATFGSSGVFAASLLDAGWTPGAAVTVRLVIAALALTVPALVVLHGRWALLRPDLGTVVGYGLVAVAGCQLCYFSAVQHLDVGVALLLEYLAAVVVVGWLWVRHGARPRRRTLGGSVAAVLGLVLVLDVTGAASPAAVGVLWGLGAAAALAFYFLVSAREGSLPPLVLAWAGLWVGAAALAVAALVGVLPFAASVEPVVLLGREVSVLVPVLGLSLVAAAVAYVAGIGAARALGATLASFVGLSEVLFALLFAWLLLGQRLSPVQVVGGAVVLAGVGLVRWDELRAARAERSVVARA